MHWVLFQSFFPSDRFPYHHLVTTWHQLPIPDSQVSTKHSHKCASFKLQAISSPINSQRVTGSVYKTRVLVHRSLLIYDYQRFRLDKIELQTLFRTTDVFEDLLDVIGTYCNSLVNPLQHVCSPIHKDHDDLTFSDRFKEFHYDTMFFVITYNRGLHPLNQI